MIKSLLAAVRAIAFFIEHAVVVSAIAGLFWCSDWVLRYLGDPKIYDLFPVRYILETGEVGVIVLWVAGAVVDARDALKEPRDGE